MSVKVNTNGQARKSLAEQIDRLDAMLDGLADGLNEAVAQAVKEAVGVAVKEAIQSLVREALANPELLARLGVAAPNPPAPQTPPSPPPPPAAEAPKSGWRRCWASVGRTLAAWADAARLECRRRLGQAGRWAAGAWAACRTAARFCHPVVAGLGLGAAAGVGAYFAGPWLAAAAGGLGGFISAAAAQIRTAWRRLTTPALASVG